MAALRCGAGANASDPMGLQAAMGGPGMGGGGGMGGMQDPEMMREMMNSPMMASFMNNPDLMRSVIQNNPQVSQSFNTRRGMMDCISQGVHRNSFRSESW
jgi:ubiquilin